MNIDWNNAEQAIADMYTIQENCFNVSFGNKTKQELETLLFYIFYMRMMKTGEKIDDYIIGRKLGLTENRVRAIKERMALYYKGLSPKEWTDSFLECAKMAKYDEKSDLIKFNIPDINVMNELRHFMTENGWYDEYQLNPKLFQCNPSIFWEMGKRIKEITGGNEPVLLDENTKKALKEIESKDKNIINAITLLTKNSIKEGISELLKSGTKKSTLVVLELVVNNLGLSMPVIPIIYNAIKNAVSD